METPYADLSDVKNLTNALVQLGRDASVLADCNPDLLDAVSVNDLNGHPLDIISACNHVSAELQRIKQRVTAHREVKRQMRISALRHD